MYLVVCLLQSIIKLKLMTPILDVLIPILCNAPEEDDDDDMDEEASSPSAYAAQVKTLDLHQRNYLISSLLYNL